MTIRENMVFTSKHGQGHFSLGIIVSCLELDNQSLCMRICWCQKHLSRHGWVIASHSVLWDAITHPCPRYRLLGSTYREILWTVLWAGYIDRYWSLYCVYVYSVGLVDRLQQVRFCVVNIWTHCTALSVQLPHLVPWCGMHWLISMGRMLEKI